MNAPYTVFLANFVFDANFWSVKLPLEGQVKTRIKLRATSGDCKTLLNHSYPQAKIKTALHMILVDSSISHKRNCLTQFDK
jgi:hypothetical protein